MWFRILEHRRSRGVTKASLWPLHTKNMISIIWIKRVRRKWARVRLWKKRKIKGKRRGTNSWTLKKYKELALISNSSSHKPSISSEGIRGMASISMGVVEGTRRMSQPLMTGRRLLCNLRATLRLRGEWMLTLHSALFLGTRYPIGFQTIAWEMSAGMDNHNGTFSQTVPGTDKEIKTIGLDQGSTNQIAMTMTTMSQISTTTKSKLANQAKIKCKLRVSGFR